ncbi:Mu transposase C-terminal domain-containing protein [Pseudoalteromonas sp. Of7M-16]|uniref:Mu transposase C-terminal domain-containing protein n=1 Tax=Pseudoalteromonas sp. Of7M-16 TaxID=2917756 RepID=UPI001EF5EFBF|nr:Mu transposase C-terminal domain-containing protein [Pseudoalteromonas sp. Of7M-16]MCG7551330.1 Mu transposase C-terminal domain-containing protein [Pseudoalteromonas sp. Of7M-16]
MEVSNPNSNWIGSSVLAQLMGVGERRARTVISQGEIANQSISTREIHGVRGHAGKGLVVNVDSLPEEFRHKFYMSQVGNDSTELSALVADTVQHGDVATHKTAYRMKIALWRFELIRPALECERHSAQRGAEVKKIAGRNYVMPNGNSKKVTQDMLYRWICAYENGDRNVSDLMPKVRQDTGRKKNFIRDVDNLVKLGQLSQGAHEQIEQTIERYVISLWANNANGWRVISEYSTGRLHDMLLDAGVSQSQIDSTKSKCTVTRAYVERFRAEYKLVAIHDNDAKQFFDKYVPRITRHTDGLRPMDLIVGDVHPIDIKCRRPDGSAVYPRAIAWHDVGTGRLWFTLIMLEKGEGVRREHVAMSFASMSEAWGLPVRLYLDNGNEYKWTEMLDGFLEIAELTSKMSITLMDTERELGRILRSRPYNAPAKAIEGLFSVVEQYLGSIEGYVGGDRQDQKKQNVGKEPKAFSGSMDDFHAQCDIALERYHKRAQSALDDRSPNQKYADFISKGWGKVAVTKETLLFAFAETHNPKIDRGRFQVNGHYYFHDDLLPYSQRKVMVRWARHDPSKVLVYADGRNLTCIAAYDPEYGVLEAKGAKEQARRARCLQRVITARRKHCDRLDLVVEMADWNKRLPDAPEAPTVQKVKIAKDSELGQALEAMKQADQQVQKPKKVYDQFLTDPSNSLLDDIGWDDDDLPN